MPHSARSHLVTNAYRTRIAAIATRLEREAKRRFPSVETLDASQWPQEMASLVTQAQLEGLRAASGYLAAFYASETGKRIIPPQIPRDTVGLSRDGRPLAEALVSPLIGVKAKLKDGASTPEAIAYGLNRALRTVAFEAQQTPREALITAVDGDSHFSGFKRATKGTCGACLALSADGGPFFPVHPGCECVPEPTVVNLADRFPIPTGTTLFNSKTKEQQDAALGPDAAAKVRDGTLALGDLVAHSQMATQPDFITQAPVSDAAPSTPSH